MRRYAVSVNGRSLEVSILDRSQSYVAFEVNGVRYDVEVAPPQLPTTGPLPTAGVAPSLPRVVGTKAGATAGLSAPMPGIIVSVLVAPGDTVDIGQPLVVMEAMKMENSLPSPRAGVVEKVHVAKGDEVDNGQILVSIKAA